MSDFRLRFTADALGVLDVTSSELLVEGRTDSTKSIQAEAYKLNVYGESLAALV